MNEILFQLSYHCGKNDALKLREEAAQLDGTAIIDKEIAIPQFVNQDYSTWPIGSPVIYKDQVWKLIKPYDATVHTQTPPELRSLWDVCHTTDPAKAKPWVTPMGGSAYMKDECYRDETGSVYKALQNNLTYNAKDLPTAWKKINMPLNE